MSEAFLHYIWKHRLLDTQALVTQDGRPLEIIHPGQVNNNAGPDFFNARIRIRETVWAGNVEIHLKSSDWLKHGHQDDAAYANCVLHVVYEDDQPVNMAANNMPVLELKNRFAKTLWNNYRLMMDNQRWIACQSRLNEVDEITRKMWLQRVMVERLEEKTSYIRELLDQFKNDWEEVLFLLLAKNFGFRINALPFEMTARAIGWRCIQRYRSSVLHLEALFFGVSGLLPEFRDDERVRRWRADFNGFQSLHRFKLLSAENWKFMRMRPNNFPTLRIAQFCAFYGKADYLVSSILKINSPEMAQTIFQLSLDKYWETHFRPGSSSPGSVKKIGADAVINLIINTVVPFQFAKGMIEKNELLMEQSLVLLELIHPERNHIIREWEHAGIKPANAVESQALLQLRQAYCDQKKCLNCNIGIKLINSLP